MIGRLILALCCLATVAEAAQRVCAVPPVACIASGSYLGDGTDDRTIPTALDNPVMLFVARQTNVPDVAYWRSDTMGAGDTSCAMAHLSGATCTTNRIQAMTSGSFQVGTALNTLNVTYNWYAWRDIPDHMETFEYTGNGTSPRTIALSFTPDWCGMQLAHDNTAFLPDGFFVRSDAMPATTSFTIQANAATAGETDLITALTTLGFIVQSGANESGKTYRGWCWKAGDHYGQVLHWTGTGSGLNANCANAADVQTVTVPGAGTLQFVMFTACTAVTCDGGACGTHFSATGWRSQQTTAPSAAYFQWPLQPDGTGQIQNLTSSSFDVAGGPSQIGGGAGLNDLGRNYYGFAIMCGAP